MLCYMRHPIERINPYQQSTMQSNEWEWYDIAEPQASSSL